MADIKKMLDEEIEREFENISTLTDSKERSQAIDDLAQLHKLRIAELNSMAEAEEKHSHHLNEVASLQRQAKENKLDRIAKIGLVVFEVVVPLTFYGIWMRQGFKFEENGSFTSTTFKNLFSRFRPTK